MSSIGEGIDLAGSQILVLTIAWAVSGQTPPQTTAARAKPARAASTAAPNQKAVPSSATDWRKSGDKPTPAATATRRPSGRGDAGPRVMTQSEMQKPRSPFLTPPSSSGEVADRYNPGGPDWSEIPPWRQTSFFG